MRFLTVSLFVMFLAASASKAQSPAFSLSKRNSDGELYWLSHSSNHAPSEYDHIKDDPQEPEISIGLIWRTEPDPQSGECVGASFYWRIPRELLDQNEYEIGIERIEEEYVVFELFAPGSGEPTFSSQRRKLERRFVTNMDSLTEHVSIIELSELVEEEGVNQ